MRTMLAIVIAASLALACGSATTQGAREAAPAETKSVAPELLSGLGSHHRAITTTSPVAQRYFDQGLALVYGFNHDAAVRSFDYALAQDPACAMCAWGKAVALGPNINLPLGPDVAPEAYAAAQQAKALAPGASPVEQELIAAVAARYVESYSSDRANLDLAYANAMRQVRKSHPDDVDVAVLTAEALMNLYPWSYWTSDAKPKQHTLELVELLEWSMQQEPTHLGANHYYIHAVEEHFPEKAEPVADRLRTLAPDAGHLVHMPGHIYYRVGRYADAATVNVNAIASDEAYFARCRPGDFYRAAYYPHNIHFLWAAAATEGQSAEAFATARSLAAKTEAYHAELPLVEEFLAIPVLTLVRFGKWDAVLGEPAPPAGRAYQGAIWHYARGVAFARTRPHARGRCGARDRRGRREGPREREAAARRQHRDRCVAARDRRGASRRRDRGGERRQPGSRCRARARGRAPGRARLHGAPALVLPDASGARRRAARVGSREAGRGRLPRRSRRVAEERLVAVRPLARARSAEEGRMRRPGPSRALRAPGRART